ncbi:MAG: hypothetical protein ACOYIE_05310 [Agathobaculum sp.]|jgi:hypothetical protein|uniref:hypothetical protein n=1 Tax=Agathobaculum sp. TaxID=2048138 RepID=UPI003D8A4421
MRCRKHAALRLAALAAYGALLVCAGRSCERAYLHAAERQIRVTLTLYDAEGRPLASADRTADGRARQQCRGMLEETEGAASYTLTVEPE